MTGAITNVKTEELSSISTTNLSNTLAGRAPGLTIVGSSGFMGASSEIRMRGGFGDPLFVSMESFGTRRHSMRLNRTKSIS